MSGRPSREPAAEMRPDGTPRCRQPARSLEVSPGGNFLQPGDDLRRLEAAKIAAPTTRSRAVLDQAFHMAGPTPPSTSMGSGGSARRSKSGVAGSFGAVDSTNFAPETPVDRHTRM